MADGHREVLGRDVITTEDGAGWTAFLRGLVARGLSGVALVISDAHAGLKGGRQPRRRSDVASYALTEWTPAVEQKLVALVKAAAS